MKQNSKSSASIIISIVLALFIAKAFWSFLEFKYLPKSGVDAEQTSNLKPLYYRYSLASQKEEPKIAKPKTKSKPKPKPKPKPQLIKKFILTGIYYSKEKKLIAIKYKNKDYVLALNEELEGYKFIKLYPKYAIFSKDGQEFRLDLYSDKEKKKIKNAIVSSSQDSTIKSKENNSSNTIKRVGDTTYIPKATFNKYKHNLAEITRNIGVVPYQENGKLKGFKISYVRKGSDFDKLGVQRGDILLSVNGEPLDNFKVPMRLLQNIDSLTAATITVKRGNEIKELEYELGN